MNKIFGFGSLMSLQSLQSTVSGVTHLQPAYIRGFKREFTLWDPLGFTTSNLDVEGIGFCALDLEISDDIEDIINGVMFSVSDTEFENLKIREQEYNIVSRECFDFFTNKSLGECFFFSANKNNGKFNHGCVAQERYLDVCLRGAKEHGEMFYENFLQTTYIGNQTLKNYV